MNELSFEEFKLIAIQEVDEVEIDEEVVGDTELDRYQPTGWKFRSLSSEHDCCYTAYKLFLGNSQKHELFMCKGQVVQVAYRANELPPWSVAVVNLSSPSETIFRGESLREALIEESLHGTSLYSIQG